MRVLIADDELLARRRLSRLLSALDGVTVVGECQDGEEVLARVKEGGVDVVLLDIQMPNLTGLDTVQLLSPDGPHIIFCTAHPDHAVQAFDAGAVDYLLKPVEPARLQKALERAQSRIARKTEAGAVDRLAVPTRSGIVLLDPQTITHAVLEGELVTVHTTDAEYLTDFSLQELQDKLPAGRLERVHRRALLNLSHVTRLEPLDTGGLIARTSRGRPVEISRQSARELRRRLGLRS